ncbi:hypothetical protein H4W79_000011 [Nocardiopsis terrae]|uniref:Integral membrane protein n=1 Tax=Nocardiopsis terrae TaxID=372655 RepID=A0ABR9H9U3_9ACTN|nr:hypothetical protein [Nocardiopsis terrae]MBE1455797.1 hypothetical protein [Nocardiopsis terrae]
MSFQRNNPQPDGPHAPRPSGSQITGARIQLYAQNHPAGFALRGAALAAVATTALAIVAAAPSLTDPTNIPGWTLVGVLVAAFVGALLVAVPMYFHGRNLPEVEESDPVRYASARLQAASGRLGPDPDINHLARRLSDRLVYNSNPNYYMGGLFVVMVFAALLPLADVIGPGFDAQHLFQLAPATVFLMVFVFVYSYARGQHTRFKAFREAYDASAS